MIGPKLRPTSPPIAPTIPVPLPLTVPRAYELTTKPLLLPTSAPTLVEPTTPTPAVMTPTFWMSPVLAPNSPTSASLPEAFACVTFVTLWPSPSKLPAKGVAVLPSGAHGMVVAATSVPSA